jgi:hypothetical protein
MGARQRFWATAGRSVGLVAFALALAWPVRANAQDVGLQDFGFFAWDSASGSYSIGLLVAYDNGDGSFTAIGGILIVQSGPIEGIYELYPSPDPPGIFTSPSGAFLVDNVLWPGQNPSLDGDGLLFTGNGLEINIWGNSPTAFSYSYYSFDGSEYNLASDDAGFSLIPVSPALPVGVLQ